MNDAVNATGKIGLCCLLISGSFFFLLSIPSCFETGLINRTTPRPKVILLKVGASTRDSLGLKEKQHIPYRYFSNFIESLKKCNARAAIVDYWLNSNNAEEAREINDAVKTGGGTHIVFLRTRTVREVQNGVERYVVDTTDLLSQLSRSHPNIWFGHAEAAYLPRIDCTGVPGCEDLPPVFAAEPGIELLLPKVDGTGNLPHVALAALMADTDDSMRQLTLSPTGVVTDGFSSWPQNYHSVYKLRPYAPSLFEEYEAKPFLEALESDSPWSRQLHDELENSIVVLGDTSGNDRYRPLTSAVPIGGSDYSIDGASMISSIIGQMLDTPGAGRIYRRPSWYGLLALAAIPVGALASIRPPDRTPWWLLPGIGAGVLSVVAFYIHLYAFQQKIRIDLLPLVACFASAAFVSALAWRLYRRQLPYMEIPADGKFVFLSYSSKDRWSARKLAKMFKDKGVYCWFAEQSLRIGDEFPGEIRAAIKECVGVVVLYTKSAADSVWVQREINLAHESGKAFFPFVSGEKTGYDAHEILGTIHCVKIGRTVRHEEFYKLLPRIEKAIAQPSPPGGG